MNFNSIRIPLFIIVGLLVMFVFVYKIFSEIKSNDDQVYSVNELSRENNAVKPSDLAPENNIFNVNSCTKDAIAEAHFALGYKRMEYESMDEKNCMVSVRLESESGARDFGCSIPKSLNTIDLKEFKESDFCKAISSKIYTPKAIN